MFISYSVSEAGKREGWFYNMCYLTKQSDMIFSFRFARGNVMDVKERMVAKLTLRFFCLTIAYLNKC